MIVSGNTVEKGTGSAQTVLTLFFSSLCFQLRFQGLLGILRLLLEGSKRQEMSEPFFKPATCGLGSRDWGFGMGEPLDFGTECIEFYSFGKDKHSIACGESQELKSVPWGISLLKLPVMASIPRPLLGPPKPKPSTLSHTESPIWPCLLGSIAIGSHD